MATKTALVTRATGGQGVRVTQHLIKSGWKVHALVNDPSADRAIALKKFGDGVILVKGTLDDPASIEAALKGCDAVFLNQMPSWVPGTGQKEAGSLLDLAKAAGVKHVVHSTQLSINDPDLRAKVTGSIVAPALIDRIDIEQLVRDSGLTWTIIRPGWFMNNITEPLVKMMFPELVQGKFISSFYPDLVIPTVDVYDIGAFAAAAFNDPAKFSGKIVSVASELITVKDILAEISRASGKELDVYYRTDEEHEVEAKANPFIIGQKITYGMAKLVDMDEVKSWGIPLTSFREFLENNKDSVVPK